MELFTSTVFPGVRLYFSTPRYISNISDGTTKLCVDEVTD